ncbi:MAG: cytochrome c family protein [Blastocatellia bacterium]|nr:cytochrome c family protein [Blastocatellia bacterium]
MKLAVTMVFLAIVTLVMGGTYITSASFNHTEGAALHASNTVGQPATITLEDVKGSRKMPGKMVLDDPDNKVTENAGDKGKTPFDHDQHVALDTCVTCHHTNTKKLTKAVEEDVLKCGACHKAEESTCELEGTNEDRKFKGKTALDSQTAFHGKSEAGGDRLAGCIDCHKARAEKFPKAKAVTTCKQCHSGG